MVKIYVKRFSDQLGAKAINPRIIIGAFIIKHKLKLSDDETVLTISENPYGKVGPDAFFSWVTGLQSCACFFAKPVR